MMKNIVVKTIAFFSSLYILLHASLTLSAQEKTLISGTFIGLEDTVAVLTYIYHNDEGEQINMYDIPIVQGKFLISLEIGKPKWVYITINNKSLFDERSGQTEIIVMPGDSIHLDIENYGLSNIIPSGKGAAKFEYVKALTSYKKSNSTIKNFNAPPPPKEIDQYISQAIQGIHQAERIMENFSSSLTETEKDILLAKAYIEVYNSLTRRLCRQQLTPYQVIVRDSLLKSRQVKHLRELHPSQSEALYDNYYVVMREIALINNAIINAQDSVTNSSVEDTYNILAKYYDNADIRYNILAKFLLTRLKIQGFNDEIDVCLNDFLSDTNKDGYAHKIVQNVYNVALDNLRLDKVVGDYVLVDSMGNDVSLNNFKGKVVVLDFWFTDCAGCAFITPSLAEIEHLYKGTDVVFVSVSVDINRETWLRGIGTFSPKESIHLNTKNGMNNSIVKDHVISALPVVMIIDKRSRVYKPRATRPYQPSDKNKLIAEISEALKIN